MNRLLFSILLSSSFLYGMNHEVLCENEEPFSCFLEKTHHDPHFKANLCKKAFKECPDLNDNPERYDCRQIDLRASDGKLFIDIRITHESDKENPICSYLYDANTKALTKLN